MRVVTGRRKFHLCDVARFSRHTSHSRAHPTPHTGQAAVTGAPRTGTPHTTRSAALHPQLSRSLPASPVTHRPPPRDRTRKLTCSGSNIYDHGLRSASQRLKQGDFLDRARIFLVVVTGDVSRVEVLPSDRSHLIDLPARPHRGHPATKPEESGSSALQTARTIGVLASMTQRVSRTAARITSRSSAGLSR